ncbi:sensor histidine kinase [Natronosalvus rutilus]|uniref:histidine kinase n=1 Tax=Natronosalvus rutilus TaxID=2953753 RepID=A0A9E7SVN5_9EURY|nr:HAMP domain-containing sensor histidine kinase [Natronosalvus rutilus]UTF53186.1 HAMP domain-containing histidine kinase [Natronosalvus rutilus]
MQRVVADDDWVADLGERLPVSPLSALGLLLAATIGFRIAVENASSRALLESAFPLLAATAVVLANRRLVASGVGVRDRLTVFAYGLGGFLAAALVTALHLHVLRLDGAGVTTPLYLTLMSGTVGVAAGTVAGLYEIRQRSAVREARRQHARLEEFASVVSHDLRNPLSVAQGRLQETCRTGDPSHLEAVDHSLEQMDELIDDSLSVARNGTQVTDREPVQLVDLASEAWAVVETADSSYELSGNRTIRANPARSKRLLENLFRNAIEHAGPETVVRIGALKNGFYVEDDGPGVPEDRRESVLEQGVSSTADGSGLGLAIVRAIADAHGWDVAVAESDTGGARFEFTGVQGR